MTSLCCTPKGEPQIRRRRWLPVSVAAGIAVLTATTPARAESFELSWGWALLQLVPSPGVRWDESRGTQFSNRFQITPLSYSWGVHRRARSVRTLVVPPIARHAGSLELHLSPELVTGSSDPADWWLLRAGPRVYLPLVERGEYLSTSFGTSVFTFDQELGVAHEVGVHTMGLAGLRVVVAPAEPVRSVTVSLELRPF